MGRGEKGRAGYQKHLVATKCLVLGHFTSSDWRIYKDMFIFTI